MLETGAAVFRGLSARPVVDWPAPLLSTAAPDRSHAMRFHPAAMMTAALCAGFAFPATADDIGSAFAGPGLAAADRALPEAWPGTATPSPLGKFDPQSLSRGIAGMGLDAATDSMGTVTRNADGTTTETPASTALHDILAAEAKSASAGLPLAGTVIGPDQRTEIMDSHNLPDAMVGWLWTQDQQGNWHNCTATLIGPQTILTAAHCVFDNPSSAFVKGGNFYPGTTSATQPPPFGMYQITGMSVLKGFVENWDGKNYGSVMPWDLAELTLSEAVGRQIGWLGFHPDPGTGFAATMIGYPADKPQGTLWQTTCKIGADQIGDNAFWHDCDSFQGSSGAALFDGTGTNTVVHGVNVAEDDTRNYAVRLTPENVQWLTENYK
jgi:V8-like Glu-specific endopeptidase